MTTAALAPIAGLPVLLPMVTAAAERRIHRVAAGAATVAVAAVADWCGGGGHHRHLDRQNDGHDHVLGRDRRPRQSSGGGGGGAVTTAGDAAVVEVGRRRRAAATMTEGAQLQGQRPQCTK